MSAVPHDHQMAIHEALLPATQHAEVVFRAVGRAVLAVASRRRALRHYCA
jgi:hypothetical protein